MTTLTKQIANALITADNAQTKLQELLAKNAKLPAKQRMTKGGLSAELRTILGYDKADKKGQGAIKTRISRLLKRAGFAPDHGGGKTTVQIPVGLTDEILDLLRSNNVLDENIPAMLRAIIENIVLE
jgi:hypothetical protein